MIERYTRPEMGALWTGEARFQAMLDVEIAVSQVQSDLQIIPAAAARDILKKARFDSRRIGEIEATTRHDVIAFVSNVAENIGPHGRYVHFGMTSSDVLDTALSVMITKAHQVLKKGINRWQKSLLKLVEDHADTLCAGRTHGMHAEPTTFGYKMAGYLAELDRALERLDRAVDQAAICKMSGAVGTYSSQPPEVEQGVARKLGLKPEALATQVVPRDRHAELFWALAMLGAALERLAVELRHLQRTEVSEVVEGFNKGQKGSSAMPHKKNPISAENLTGVARLLRGYLSSSMENIALWHERDISHSSVERVIMGDAWILADYGCHRMADLLDSLQVDKERMLKNMSLSQGQLMSSHLLLGLVSSGWSREEAYQKIQSLSHSLKPSGQLVDSCLHDKQVLEALGEKRIKEIFSGRDHVQRSKKHLKSFLRQRKKK